MKTVKKVILIVLLVLLVVIAAVGICQKDNIKSFINSVRYSEAEIAEKMDANKQKLQNIANNTEYIDIRQDGGLTPEEEQALAAGEITTDDAVKLVRGQTSLEEIRNTDETSETTSGPAVNVSVPPVENKKNTIEEKPPELTKEEIMTEKVSNIIAELYVAQSDFISQLEATAMQARDDFIAKGNHIKHLPEVADAYLPKAAELEKVCDAKVNDLLAQLETALKEGGGDLSLINEIRQYYYEEKGLKKAYYFNRYLSK